MLQSYAEEYQELCKFFNDEWTALGNALEIAWENVDLDDRGGETGLVQFSIINGDSTRMTIGAPGSNTVRHPGVISVNVFTPMNIGKLPGLRYADDVASILRRISIAGIIVRDPGIRSLGDDGKYYQVNVSAGFQRDSLF